ncbi:dihydrofolate reductase family protein [Leucobacter sp. HNU]|uniref:dihydrofolate reductase family protein n=1 Tax=Leucobacter sp. HNU TaxID=3236805 RepID=UPI003A7FE519
MLTISMSVSLDGFISDRSGSLDWGAPSPELFAFQLDHVRSLGAYLLGRRLYETMRVWETDPALRSTPANADFADVWAALPKTVFSRTVDRVEGCARLADAPLREEIERALGEAGGRTVSIGGADLAGQALRMGMIDEIRLLRCPVILGGGTPFFPELASPIRAELAELRRFAPGIAFERYRLPRGGRSSATG